MLSIRSEKIDLLVEKHTHAIMGAVERMKTIHWSGEKLEAIKFFETILKEVFGQGISLEQIIRARPAELEQLYTKFNNSRQATEYFPMDDGPKKNQSFESKKFAVDLYSKLGERHRYLFKFRGKQYDGSWSRRSFFTELGLKTCPYCNRNDIQVVEGEGQSRQTGQLDHVIPKSLCPPLAVSFFNLVPVCSTCNHLKGANEKIIANPYDERIDLAEQSRWGIKLAAASFPHQSNSFDLVLKLDPGLARDGIEKVQELVQRVRLLDQYQKHKEYVQELVRKQHLFNASYRKELYRKYGGTLFSSEEELFRGIFGRHAAPENLHERPLNKLARDVQDHLDGRTGEMISFGKDNDSGTA